MAEGQQGGRGGVCAHIEPLSQHGVRLALSHRRQVCHRRKPYGEPSSPWHISGMDIGSTDHPDNGASESSPHTVTFQSF